jgi:hypothetical protein
MHFLALHQYGFQGPKFIYNIFKQFYNTSLKFILPVKNKANKRIGPHNEDVISFLVGILLGDYSE